VLENSEDIRQSQACYGALKSGKHVVVNIRDYGTGIPEDKIERVFEAFFRTKSKGEGTGLGLSVASNLLEIHSGAIGLNNEVDPPGLRVKIVLPLANETGVC